MVKNPLAMQKAQETQVQSLGQEVFLEEGMTNLPTILAYRIPWTEDPGRLQLIGSQRIGHDWSNSVHLHGLLYIHIYISVNTQTHRYRNNDRCVFSLINIDIYFAVLSPVWALEQHIPDLDYADLDFNYSSLLISVWLGT